MVDIFNSLKLKIQDLDAEKEELIQQGYPQVQSEESQEIEETSMQDEAELQRQAEYDKRMEEEREKFIREQRQVDRAKMKEKE